MNSRRIATQESTGSQRSRLKASRGGAYHWREYCIADLLPPGVEGARVLLLGCGDAGEREYLERLGCAPLGVDIKRSSKANVIGDAHELPFRDDGFDLVLSMQVLEHVCSPWIAVQEASRVLRPGGWFVGSVAFMKPFHNSYFHMTHKGVQHLLDIAGLEPDMFAGAQSVSYSIFGSMIPLGSRAVRRAVFGCFDWLIANVRVWIRFARRWEDPDRPMELIGGGVPLSFRAKDRLRYAPAVVFRARKKV